MREDLCLQLARVVALVRERIVSWPGYRGQGRRPEFVEGVVQLALYLSKRQRRNPGSFPIARMALDGRIQLHEGGMSESRIRSALRCLVEIGFVEHEGDLVRKRRSPHWAPRQFRLAAVVRSIFGVSAQEQDSKGKKEEKKEGVQTPPLILRAGMAAGNAVKDAAKALLRSLFPGDDAAFEAHWRSLPGR